MVQEAFVLPEIIEDINDLLLLWVILIDPCHLRAGKGENLKAYIYFKIRSPLEFSINNIVMKKITAFHNKTEDCTLYLFIYFLCFC